MYERKIPVDLDCPLRLTMSLIDSKWKSCILDELRYRAMRPSELHKALPEATPRVLDLQLKEMVEDGLIAKTIYPELPPRSEYSITSLGMTLIPIIDAMQFVKSVAQGNSAYAKELFIDEAVLFGYLDGKLEHGSIEQFYQNVDNVGPDSGFKARVDVIDVEETLAVVRVLEENWGGRIDFTDYLLLMKMNGEWKCVAKAYNQNSNTIQK